MNKKQFEKFIIAQNIGDGIGCSLNDGLDELKRTSIKKKHWSWYGFPQLSGLGNSNLAKKYSIVSFKEAIEYLKDPLLGGNLLKTYMFIWNALKHNQFDLNKTLGNTDSLKLKSSVTLFYCANQTLKHNIINSNVIEKLFILLGKCQFTYKVIYK